MLTGADMETDFILIWLTKKSVILPIQDAKDKKIW